MNREIKFRAWILDEDFTGKWEMSYDIAFEDFEPINDLLASVEHLMQFTGLKDKNGKEIYEGDIIKADPLIAGKNVEYIGVVEYHGLSFGNMVKGLGMQDFYDRRYTEVIGNIYENSELLEVKV